MSRGDARVIESVRFLPDGLKIRILAKLDDGASTSLFSYYPDELSFTERELVGLSVDHALDLFHRKDMEFLQS